MHKYIYIFICFLSLHFFSCSPSKLVGKTFFGSNNLRSISITFVNDSICEIVQKFYCKSISNEYNNIHVSTKYREMGKLKVDYCNTIRVAHSKSRYFKGIKLNNIDSNVLVRYTPIPAYFDLCVTDSILNRLAGKIPEGIIFHFTNDTILINKRNILAAGLKLLPNR